MEHAPVTVSKKRKKYKFGRFAELPNCFEAFEFTPQIRRNFIGDRPLVLGVGAGTGLFLLEQAKLSPERCFIALDVKADRLYTGAKAANALGITNICFVRINMMSICEIIANYTVSQLWLTFSDPFPKKRAAKHRLTHQNFLTLYRQLMLPGATLHMKTDSHDLFDWSLEQLVVNGRRLTALSYDLHASHLPALCKIMTTFEQRFVAQGLAIHYLAAVDTQ